MLTKVFPILVILLGSVLLSAGFNLFLVPHGLLSGGLSGVAIVIGYLTNGNIGILYFLLNLPLIVWGWFVIGKRFIVLSILSVLATSWFLQLVPQQQPIVADPLIASVFGGVLIGIGTGISLRSGGSTGGFDIVGSIVTRKRDFPLGSLLFALNGLVVLSLGYIESWDLALSSMLSIFVAGKVVDSIHVRHIKITAFIITNRSKEIAARLLKVPRGVTIVKTQGAFTNKEKDMLMTVTTRYELAELKKNIREIDPKAFVNIVETVEVIGEFRKN